MFADLYSNIRLDDSGTSATKAYLYQQVSGIKARTQYSLSIDVRVDIPPETECTLDYGAGAQTFRTTSLDSFSPTRYQDALSGAFNVDASFFFIRLTCTPNAGESAEVGLSDISLTTL